MIRLINRNMGWESILILLSSDALEAIIITGCAGFKHVLTMEKRTSISVLMMKYCSKILFFT